MGPLLILIYINDFQLPIKHSEVHHFEYDTNLLNFNSCVNSVNVQVNIDFKNLTNWVKANEVSLNTEKTELVPFTSPKNN